MSKQDQLKNIKASIVRIDELIDLSRYNDTLDKEDLLAERRNAQRSLRKLKRELKNQTR